MYYNICLFVIIQKFISYAEHVHEGQKNVLEGERALNESPCALDLFDLCGMYNPDSLKDVYDSRMCLKENSESVSSSCLQILNVLNPSIIEPCYSDIKRFCPNAVPGNKNVHNCLYASSEDISVRCSRALEDEMRSSEPKISDFVSESVDNKYTTIFEDVLQSFAPAGYAYLNKIMHSATNSISPTNNVESLSSITHSELPCSLESSNDIDSKKSIFSFSSPFLFFQSVIYSPSLLLSSSSSIIYEETETVEYTITDESEEIISTELLPSQGQHIDETTIFLNPTNEDKVIDYYSELDDDKHIYRYDIKKDTYTEIWNNYKEDDDDKIIWEIEYIKETLPVAVIEEEKEDFEVNNTEEIKGTSGHPHLEGNNQEGKLAADTIIRMFTFPDNEEELYVVPEEDIHSMHRVESKLVQQTDQLPTSHLRGRKGGDTVTTPTNQQFTDSSATFASMYDNEKMIKKQHVLNNLKSSQSPVIKLSLSPLSPPSSTSLLSSISTLTTSIYQTITTSIIDTLYQLLLHPTH